MTILEVLKKIIQDYDRRFYVRRNFNSLAAMAGLVIAVLSLILLMMQGTSWPWIVLMWTSAAAAYLVCRSKWLRADSDIIGSAMETFNQAFPVNTNERKIAMKALEDMSSASTTAAMIVALFGGNKSLHYYYGWTEPPVNPPPERSQQTHPEPAVKKQMKFSGVLPLQTERKISDLHEGHTNNKSIRLVPDRQDKKSS